MYKICLLKKRGGGVVRSLRHPLSYALAFVGNFNHQFVNDKVPFPLPSDLTTCIASCVLKSGKYIFKKKIYPLCTLLVSINLVPSVTALSSFRSAPVSAHLPFQFRYENKICTLYMFSIIILKSCTQVLFVLLLLFCSITK